MLNVFTSNTIWISQNKCCRQLEFNADGDDDNNVIKKMQKINNKTITYEISYENAQQNANSNSVGKQTWTKRNETKIHIHKCEIILCH